MALRLAFWSALLCLVSVVDGSTEPVAQPSTTQHSGIHRSTTKGWGFGFDAGGATGSFDNQPSDVCSACQAYARFTIIDPSETPANPRLPNPRDEPHEGP